MMNWPFVISLWLEDDPVARNGGRAKVGCAYQVWCAAVNRRRLTTLQRRQWERGFPAAGAAADKTGHSARLCAAIRHGGRTQPHGHLQPHRYGRHATPYGGGVQSRASCGPGKDAPWLRAPAIFLPSRVAPSPRRAKLLGGF